MVDFPGPLIKVHIHDATATVILNRPEKRNALSRAMIAELAQVLHDLHMQRSARAVILSGTGPAFCAGMDLAEMAAARDEPDGFAVWEKDARAYQQVLEVMLRFPKPIIAAVDGAAVAGGAGLVLASDLVVASDAATFGLPEVRRGLVAGMVAPLLHFRIGAARAAYLLLTGETVSATRAHDLGIVHEVVGATQIWVRAQELASQCAAGAAEALSLSKRMLNETIGADLMTTLAAGTAVSSTSRTTDAAAEGLAAFLEKREPDWP